MKIIHNLMSNYSQWNDVGIKENQGWYSLVQVKYRLSDNKKVFRTTKIGFISQSISKESIFSTLQSLKR